LGACPTYLKTHSRGEFIFDHAWADAYERAGGRYYPKLLIGVPFTPVTGRRRLVRSDTPNAQAIQDALAQAAVQIVSDNNISSLHVNFIDAFEWENLAALGFLKRSDQQFHWKNDDYSSFDDFLAVLTSRKRKDLRKERAKAQTGVRYEHISGSALTEDHWDAFYDFYLDTGARKWGSPYLNREFFSVLNDRMADKVLLILAYDEETNLPIAGALNMIGSDTLYGRYWGCNDMRPMLHFETCYYQAIDYAIEHKLKFVEAGAQGGHKLARGYTPTPIHSAHWITNQGFSDAIAQYLEHEREQVEADINYLGQRTPFRKGDD
jgi:predicted N-acyltransferase